MKEEETPDNAARWQRVQSLYHAALERKREERLAFLNDACSEDQLLRREVESLLSSHDEAGSFLDSPALEVAARAVADDKNIAALGTTIGPYKITGLLGSGGMGVVYLAEDSRFGRKVALKLLPAQFTSDENRLRRFQQEARAALALNHPNVITIFEIGRHDSTHFIATEFIDGHTLRDHLKDQSLGVNEALDISIQVAAALSAAHEAHIIHRDIKPENIMLRRDGYVKVLDFGLAKPSERQSASPESTTAFMRVDTDPGTVLGTVNYMSPEQARGLEVDERTDIFSLGVVLFEMLAGRTPFEGATPNDVIASILSKEPQRITRYANEVPDALEWVVTKALVKDRTGRYQTAAELLADLKRLKQRLDFEALETAPNMGSGAGTTKTTSRTQIVDTDPEPGSQTGQVANSPTMSSAEYLITRIIRHKKAAAATSAALILIIAVAAWAIYRLVGPGNPSSTFEKMKVTRLTTSGSVSHAAISPDGKYVAYVMDDAGDQSIWIKHIATSSNAQIVLPTNARYSGLTFSLDGNYVYYVKTDWTQPVNVLYQVPVLGGAPKRVAERVHGSITLSPDGTQIAFARWAPLSFGKKVLIVANMDGSGERILTSRNMPETIADSAWSPDGKIIACTFTNIANATVRLVGVAVADGTEKPLSPQKWNSAGRIAWLPDGVGLIVPASDKPTSPLQIWLLSYPSGDVRRITNDLNGYSQVSVTADAKSLVTVQSDLTSNIWVVPAGDSTRGKQITSGAGRYAAGVFDDVAGLGRMDIGGGVCWTPDSRIVYHASTNGKLDIWLMDADGRNQKQLTTGTGANFFPSVSPAGYVVYQTDRGGNMEIWRIDSDGGNPRRLASDTGTLPSCTPDGRWVVYSEISSGQIYNLWKVPMDGGTPVAISDPNRQKLVFRAAVSPDGTLLACNYIPTASDWQLRLAAVTLDGANLVRIFDILSINAWRETRWTADGRTLTYIQTDKGVSNIWGQPLEGGKPVQLTDFKSDLIFSWDWSRDGKQLAVARGRVVSDVVLISDFR